MMKSIKLNMAILIVILTVGSCTSTADPEIHGRWKTRFRDGSNVLAVFRNDGTHDYFVNDKLFSSGTTFVHHDTIKTADPICKADYYATYKVDFITADSMRFIAIADSCRPRKQDLDGASFKRQKEKQ